MTEKTIHEGRNVKRIREMLGIKQDVLANDLGLSQQAISQLEQKEALDKDMLEKISALLKVPVEAIKNFDEERTINIIASNNNGKDNSSAVNFQCTFNPLEKLMETVEENKKLYERLLQSEKEKVEMLQGVIAQKK
ncbi:MAG: transcriptional regulator [Chitinophagaceae bacterium]|nr:transcriptional regulator [Chitinophagaceae bacterium]